MTVHSLHPEPAWLPAELAAHASVQEVAKGAALFRTGDAVGRFHFVQSGELAAIRRMPNGAEAVMLTARPGEFFAEASLFLPVYTCEARAFSDCQILSWPRQAFHAALMRYPEAAMAFARTLAVNLRRQCSRVERLRLKNAPERVLHFLACEVGPDGWAVLAGTLQDWASELALEPETLYRVLAQLEKAGQIEREVEGNRRRLRLVGQSGMVCVR